MIRADLKAKGMPIGNMDMLIAAHTLSLNLHDKNPYYVHHKNTVGKRG